MKLITSLLIVIFFISCSNDDNSSGLILFTADFTVDRDNIDQCQSTQFTSAFENAESYFWTFEGGEPATSTLEQPTITYNDDGKFDVTLVVTNSNNSDTITKEDFITVNRVGVPMSRFTSSATNINVFESVTFTDTSINCPTEREWSFPFGTPSSSTEQTVTVVYEQQGTFDVELMVSSERGFSIYTDFDHITVN